MTTRKKIGIGAGILAACLLGVHAVRAGSEAAGRGGACGRAGERAQVIKALIELDITAEQKAAMAGVLKQHRAEIEPLADKLVDARLALFEQVHAAAFDEQAVREASRAVARCDEDLAVARARIVREVRVILTDEQRVLLETRRDAMLEHVTAKLDTARDIVNMWIDKHAAN